MTDYRCDVHDRAFASRRDLKQHLAHADHRLLLERCPCGTVITWDGRSGRAGKQATKEAHEQACTQYRALRDARRAEHAKKYGTKAGNYVSHTTGCECFDCRREALYAEGDPAEDCECGCEGDIETHVKWSL
ncbi:MAG: hypothetical protein KGL39_19960 [Patescibacteria group bacterium]|nr:hypothetical protein [Patescibacteria group bacterium]